MCIASYLEEYENIKFLFTDWDVNLKLQRPKDCLRVKPNSTTAGAVSFLHLHKALQKAERTQSAVLEQYIMINPVLHVWVLEKLAERNCEVSLFLFNQNFV